MKTTGRRKRTREDRTLFFAQRAIRDARRRRMIERRRIKRAIRKGQKQS